MISVIFDLISNAITRSIHSSYILRSRYGIINSYPSFRFNSFARSSLKDDIEYYHIPVMLSECCEQLLLVPNGLYVDCTLGGGGHTAAILSKGCRVIGIDQDPDAISEVTFKLGKFIESGHLEITPSNFRHLPSILKNSRISAGEKADGILLDLGVSSHQINNASRGFSFGADGPLDMRMSKGSFLEYERSNPLRMKAAEILNEWDSTKISDVLFQYGEEPRSRVIAREIIASRPFNTTSELTNVISRITYHKHRAKTLARCFQALRIVVNDEMNALDEFLANVHTCIKPGGRLVVLSYHSLEDRKIKQLFKFGPASSRTDASKTGGGSGLRKYHGQHESYISAQLYGNSNGAEKDNRIWKPVLKKALGPSLEETERNRRSRSAKMRVGERLPEPQEFLEMERDFGAGSSTRSSAQTDYRGSDVEVQMSQGKRPYGAKELRKRRLLFMQEAEEETLGKQSEYRE